MLELNQCYNMDCMKGMAQFPDGFFDLAVVDPPYFSGPERRGYYGSRVSKTGVHRDYPITPKWDVPGKDYFDELLRVSKHYIIWGCNYFDYHFAPGRISGSGKDKFPDRLHSVPTAPHANRSPLFSLFQAHRSCRRSSP